MGSTNSLQNNSEFSQVREIELSDEFASAISLDRKGTSTESSVSRTVMTVQPPDMVDRSAKDDPNVSSSSRTSSNTTVKNSQETSEKLVKENEKLQIKFPFAFISEENIPYISVVVQNGNAITFTMKSKTTFGFESDPEQPSPSMTLENLDSTISREDLAQLPTKIFPPLLGWKGISCETLKLHNLFINWPPFEQPFIKDIVTSGIKRLHLLNFTLSPSRCINLFHMKNLEELNISLPDFDDGLATPISLKSLRVHCPKSKKPSQSTCLRLFGDHSVYLEHV
jgi:hypothetical protein